VAIDDRSRRTGLHPLHRVTASAGSGKTHAPAQRYLHLLLSDRIPASDLRNLLAVTFTDKAAAEMKPRILGWLKALHFGSDAGLTREFSGRLGLSPEALASRAWDGLLTILPSHRDFNVRTIDSFMVGLARGKRKSRQAPFVFFVKIPMDSFTRP